MQDEPYKVAMALPFPPKLTGYQLSKQESHQNNIFDFSIWLVFWDKRLAVKEPWNYRGNDSINSGLLVDNVLRKSWLVAWITSTRVICRRLKTKFLWCQLQLVQSVKSTNGFIKNLLTTTPSSSHISDFRQQKRTDSRADRPDTFPGFDLQLDSTTASPRKRRRQAYSKLIRLFLENTRDRLETIRDVIKDESELHFRLTRPPGEPNENSAVEPNGDIRFLTESDDEQRQFIDFAFADSTRADESAIVAKPEQSSRDEAAQTYLNSLFAAVGYSRITSTPNPIDETTRANVISRYLINPLRSAWNATRERFNLFNENSTLVDSDGQTTLFRGNFFDNTADITPKMHTNLESTTDRAPNENGVDNFNYSLPLTQRVPYNVTNGTQTNETTIDTNANKVNESHLGVEFNGDDHTGSDKKPRNTSTGTEDAATAFRNAFLKYSNSMQHPTEYANIQANATGETVQMTKDNSNATKNAKLLNAKLFSGNLFDGNSSHIQVVPAKKLKTIESLDAVGDSASSVEVSTELNEKNAPDSAGVLILEIFGTVIGMTWRAVSEIPNYFKSRNRNMNA